MDRSFPPMMLLWIQFYHECLRLCRRPSCWVGLALCFGAELCFALLAKLPGARAPVARFYERLHLPLGENFSGLTEAGYLRTIIMGTIGAACLAWVSAELIAREAEAGTLRMTFARPVTRGRILSMKIAAVVFHAVFFTWFVSATCLGLGLLLEGSGDFVYGSLLEGVVGSFDFWPGIARYTLATGLLAVSTSSFSILVLAISCFATKPVTAAILGLTIFVADDTLRHLPAMASISQYFLTARVTAWLQAYNDPLVWERISGRYSELLGFDVLLIAVAAWAWNRREFKT